MAVTNARIYAIYPVTVAFSEFMAVVNSGVINSDLQLIRLDKTVRQTERRSQSVSDGCVRTFPSDITPSDTCSPEKYHPGQTDPERFGYGYG